MNATAFPTCFLYVAAPERMKARAHCVKSDFGPYLGQLHLHVKHFSVKTNLSTDYITGYSQMGILCYDVEM